MHWAILTPRRSVCWNGAALTFGPGANRSDAPPADAAEALWLTYYASIFNPARLKLAMMRKEMPRRYWKNLPESVLIQPLAAGAAERSGRMVEQVPAEPVRRRPASSRALAVAARPAVLHAPGSLAELHDATQRCRECPIGAHATQAVNGEGNERARLMLVGEQPGDREDLRGRPFVGPAGQLLDRALEQLRWPRDQLYLTNAVRHFKFELRGKRRIHKTPAQQEAAACLHWLESEIALVKPAAAIALGATAARALLGRAVSVTRERGRWFVRADGVRVLVTLHPSALLRMEPAERAQAYDQWVADLATPVPDGGRGAGDEGLR
jgi:DNA polymerase